MRGEVVPPLGKSLGRKRQMTPTFHHRLNQQAHVTSPPRIGQPAPKLKTVQTKQQTSESALKSDDRVHTFETEKKTFSFYRLDVAKRKRRTNAMQS